MLELIGLLVSVAKATTSRRSKISRLSFLGSSNVWSISVCFCVLVKEHSHYGVAVHKVLSRSSDCQELLTYV